MPISTTKEEILKEADYTDSRRHKVSYNKKQKKCSVLRQLELTMKIGFGSALKKKTVWKSGASISQQLRRRPKRRNSSANFPDG